MSYRGAWKSNSAKHGLLRHPVSHYRQGEMASTLPQKNWMALLPSNHTSSHPPATTASYPLLNRPYGAEKNKQSKEKQTTLSVHKNIALRRKNTRYINPGPSKAGDLRIRLRKTRTFLGLLEVIRARIEHDTSSNWHVFILANLVLPEISAIQCFMSGRTCKSLNPTEKRFFSPTSFLLPTWGIRPLRSKISFIHSFIIPSYISATSGRWSHTACPVWTLDMVINWRCA